tara:strand:- start:31363 stop:31791 length:429 start_codon:yes stop_codon:yes gene_type:complete
MRASKVLLLGTIIFCILSGCATPVSGTKNFHGVSSYPDWVLNPDNEFTTPTGVECVKIEANKPNEKERNKALLAARLQILKKINSKQSLYSTETVSMGDGELDYAAMIKSKTYGRIGRNEVTNETVLEKIPHSEYCVSVSLV